MTFLVLKKKNIIMFLIIVILAVSVGSTLLFLNNQSESVFSVQEEGKVREYHMVTGEFKSKLPNGKEIEAYRWDPGTIVISKGEKVNLIIYGVNGAEHPFIIEGTDIKGVVKKGEETVIPLHFTKEGTYRLICYTHKTKEQNGPMIAYIVVD